MGALYILIPVALFFLAFAVWAFFWAVDHDQFEDLESEGERILLDDPAPTRTHDDAAGSEEAKT